MSWYRLNFDENYELELVLKTRIDYDNNNKMKKNKPMENRKITIAREYGKWTLPPPQMKWKKKLKSCFS